MKTLIRFSNNFTSILHAGAEIEDKEVVVEREVNAVVEESQLGLVDVHPIKQTQYMLVALVN